MKRNILISLILALTTISIYAQDPNIIWQRTLGGDKREMLYDMVKTSDGGYFLGGMSASGISGEKTEVNRGTSGRDYWVVKLDTYGNIEWDKTIGGSFD